MDKQAMREWVASLEGVIDNKLNKWKKEGKIENGEAIHLGWQFELTHIQLDIFWEDNQETVKLVYRSPRADQSLLRHGLNNKTFNEIVNRIGDLEHDTLFPPDRLYGLNG